MSEPTRQEDRPGRPPALFPRKLGFAILVLLSLQLALGYLQGALLNRQHEELRSLRTEIQDLTATLEQGYGVVDPGAGEDAWKPARRLRARPRTYAAAGMVVLDGDEEDRARKELQQSKESAGKAVEDARKAQSQVSIEENARKAEVARKVDEAGGRWQKWTLIAIGVVVLAFLVRSWLRGRG